MTITKAMYNATTNETNVTKTCETKEEACYCPADYFGYYCEKWNKI